MKRREPGGVTDRVPTMFDEIKPAVAENEILFEADRCLECGGPHAPAPCTQACPASVDVPGFIKAIAAGEPGLAAQIIFRENLLGGTCARVCPSEMLCEGHCVLHHERRRPVEISRLQRHASEYALKRGMRLREAAPANGRRVAVIGAGPAGMVAAGELASLGYDVTVFEGRSEAGGLVRFAIAPFRQMIEPLPQEAAHLEDLGVKFRRGEPIDGPEKLRKLESEFHAIVLGVGLGKDVEVRYPGDELPGVWESLPFIEAIKTGSSPSVGKRVAVIGGGNTAMDVAREALRLGATHVTVLYRRTQAEMPAFPLEYQEALEENIEFRWLVNPTRFLGEERLEAVECDQMELGEPDESGRRRPVRVPGSAFVLQVDTLIKAIGQRPRLELLGWIEGLRMADGKIAIDALTGQTGNPKYFAAGDATGGNTVVEAVRGAKIAAGGVHRWLEGMKP